MSFDFSKNGAVTGENFQLHWSVGTENITTAPGECMAVEVPTINFKLRVGSVYLKDSGDRNVMQVLRFISQYNIKRVMTFKVVVNSMGGSLYTALEVIALMRDISNCGVTVATFGVGAVMSAGTLIFSSGDLRTLDSNVSYLIHDSRVGAHGKSSDVKVHTEAMRKQTKNIYKDFYKDVPKKIIKAALNGKEVYLTPKQCVKFGLADLVA